MTYVRKITLYVHACFSGTNVYVHCRVVNREISSIADTLSSILFSVGEGFVNTFLAKKIDTFTDAFFCDILVLMVCRNSLQSNVCSPSAERYSLRPVHLNGEIASQTEKVAALCMFNE